MLEKKRGYLNRKRFEEIKRHDDMEYAKLLADANLNPTDFKLLPFSPKEAKAIKVWLRKSRAGQQANGATLVDKYWREILESVG